MTNKRIPSRYTPLQELTELDGIVSNYSWLLLKQKKRIPVADIVEEENEHNQLKDDAKLN